MREVGEKKCKIVGGNSELAAHLVGYYGERIGRFVIKAEWRKEKRTWGKRSVRTVN